MAIWTRLGFLIPVLWILGFTIFYWVDRMGWLAIPDKWIVTVGHLLGTIFVWIFSISIGDTKIKEMMDVQTGETTIVTKPHSFMMLPAKMWGIILTLLCGWFLYKPPGKEWIDKTFMQKDALMDKISQANVDITKEREWTSAKGNKISATFLRLEQKDGAEHVVFRALNKDGVLKEMFKPLDEMSADDIALIRKNAKK